MPTTGETLNGIRCMHGKISYVRNRYPSRARVRTGPSRTDSGPGGPKTINAMTTENILWATAMPRWLCYISTVSRPLSLFSQLTTNLSFYTAMNHDTNSPEFQSCPIGAMTSPQPIESDTQDHKDKSTRHGVVGIDGQLEMAEVKDDSLPPQDGGPGAWLFLFGACVFEIVSWGKRLVY
jgi:hypothetical protein